MWPVYPATQTLAVIAALLLITLTSARVLQPAWWQSRPVRAITFLSFATMLAGVALWQIGGSVHGHPLAYVGAGLAYSSILIAAPAVLVLPFTALTDRLLTRAPAPAPASAPAPAPALTRRSFIRAGSAALPGLAALTSADGLLSSRNPPRIPVIPMRYDDLHADLEGLRILQLSDLHLGAYAGLADLAAGLDAAISTQRPDLIVLTGDLADDPGLIPGALELIARARSRHGTLASLGNHEYLHDITVTRPLFEASKVPLLVSAGRTLRIGRAKLFVGGADDPVHMHGDIAAMLRPSIERAAAHAPADADFRLLLCHRPEGFGPANDAGFDLTLAGHTHGGQLGLFGRSILEKLSPGTGWWGTYARARSKNAGAPSRSRLSSSPARLYTTSGFGHWFPFRVGCPTEMPLLVLERTPGPPVPSPRPSRV